MKIWTVLECKEHGDYQRAEVVGAFSTEKLAIDQIERIHCEIKNSGVKVSEIELTSYPLDPRAYEFETDTGKWYGFIIDELTLDEFV